MSCTLSLLRPQVTLTIHTADTCWVASAEQWRSLLSETQPLCGLRSSELSDLSDVTSELEFALSELVADNDDYSTKGNVVRQHERQLCCLWPNHAHGEDRSIKLKNRCSLNQ